MPNDTSGNASERHNDGVFDRRPTCHPTTSTQNGSQAISWRGSLIFFHLRSQPTVEMIAGERLVQQMGHAKSRDKFNFIVTDSGMRYVIRPSVKITKFRSPDTLLEGRQTSRVFGEFHRRA